MKPDTVDKGQVVDTISKTNPSLLNAIFDKKKYLKTVKKRLDRSTLLCRFKVTKVDKTFNQINKKLIEVLKPSIQRPSAYTNGNIFYVLGMVDEYLEHTKEVSSNVLGEKDLGVVFEAQEALQVKQRRLLSDLVSNLKNPVKFNPEESTDVENTND